MAADAERPFVEDPAEWGRLAKIVRPEYPPEALANLQTGIVDVTGEVTIQGRLRSIHYEPQGAASPAFVQALKEVAPHWIFTTPLGDDCMPSAKPVTTRVSFEIDNGVPRIFVTHRKLDPASGRASALFKPLTMVKPKYPLYMLKKGMTGKVYSRVEIDSSGAVTNVRSQAWASWAYQTEGGPAWFEKATDDAIRQWRYPPDDSGKTRIACRQTVFNLTN
jgi:hypothetical protein